MSILTIWRLSNDKKIESIKSYNIDQISCVAIDQSTKTFEIVCGGISDTYPLTTEFLDTLKNKGLLDTSLKIFAELKIEK